jgi:phage terminase large subunit
MIGTATESCIRLLSDFKKSGFIDLIGKKNNIERLGQTKKISRLTTLFITK